MFLKYALIGVIGLFVIICIAIAYVKWKYKPSKSKPGKTNGGAITTIGREIAEKNTKHFQARLEKELVLESGQVEINRCDSLFWHLLDESRIDHGLEIRTGAGIFGVKWFNICIIYTDPLHPKYYLLKYRDFASFMCDDKSIEILINKAQAMVHSWERNPSESSQVNPVAEC